MEALALIVGIGIVCFILLYFAFNLEKQHIVLKLLLILTSMSLLILVPKAGLDYKDNCDIVVENSTLNSTNNMTTYDYIYFCNTNDNSTQSSFYKVFLWFIRAFILYLAVYFVWTVFMYFKDTILARKY